MIKIELVNDYSTRRANELLLYLLLGNPTQGWYKIKALISIVYINISSTVSLI